MGLLNMAKEKIGKLKNWKNDGRIFCKPTKIGWKIRKSVNDRDDALKKPKIHVICVPE